MTTNQYYAIELPDMVVMHVFSHESVFSELDRTAFGVPGGFCSSVSVLLLVDARRDTSRAAVLTSNTLHSLSRSLLSSWRTFTWNFDIFRYENVKYTNTLTCRVFKYNSLESEPQLELSLSSVVNFL